VLALEALQTMPETQSEVEPWAIFA
jgi:hypothetical protein